MPLANSLTHDHAEYIPLSPPPAQMQTMSIAERPERTMTAPMLSVIIPAYREAENLPVLVPRLCAVLAAHAISAEIIIVDDNSPDATLDVCAELQRQYPVRLYVRKTERGLSSAVLHGLNRASGQILLVMDADLSHPPEKVPELVAALDNPDVDFVIGSRYVPGASTDETWGVLRWLNSRIATLLARPFTTARDPMAGFFAIRRTTYDNSKKLNAIGYKIGLELIVKCGCTNVHEVPIHFSDRLHGQSKLTFREQLYYLQHLCRLAKYKLCGSSRLSRFLMVGATGAAIDIPSFCLFLQFLPLPAARGIAIWTAMTWNFYWNRRFTFADRQSDRMAHQYAGFCASSLGGATISWLTSVLLCEVSGFIAEYPAFGAAIGIIAGVTFNFAASSRWVFRPNVPSEAKGTVRLAALDSQSVRQTGLNDLPSA